MGMKEQDHDLIWKYIDGDCTTLEVQYVEDQIEANPNFNKEWKQKLVLHETLKEIETHQPSMRFVMNVMDALPATNFGLRIAPLVPKRWIWKILIGSCFFVTTMVAVTWGNMPISAHFIEQPPSLWMTYTHKILAIPASIWNIIAALTFAVLSLLGMDYWMKRRFK